MVGKGFSKGARRRRHAASNTPIPAIPGYGEVDLGALLADMMDPKASLGGSREDILAFLRARDVVAVLAKSGEQLLREMTTSSAIGPGASGLDQVHVEVLQAFALVAGAGRAVPTSPRSIVRLWRFLRSNVSAYLASIDPGIDISSDEDLARRVRLRTACYRNIFNSDDAMEVVPALLSRMDGVSRQRSSFAMSDLARAMYAIFVLVGERLDERLDREEILRAGGDVDSVIATMLCEAPSASRLWNRCRVETENEKVRGWAGFQLSEMLCAQLFTFARADLSERFGTPIAEAFFACALPLDGLAEIDLDRIYLDNPIWRRPFIALDVDTLFLPIPSLLVSFPFAIVEALIGSDQRLQKSYSDARARYLEDDVERIVCQSLPSARVHRSVKWTDPKTGKGFEHDVVAVLGMHVLIFEAKSGKLAPASRRGAVGNLRTNFSDLFVEPGRQAARLEALLACGQGDVELIDRDGVTVRVDPGGPIVVHKFGVCIEQIASVTSSRRLFRELDLLHDDQEWAPILTLGELRMISSRLDSEVSFLHYLSRRSTIDDMLDFIADEQDLLAMYLINGFALDASALEGRQVSFLAADAGVRGRITPSEERTAFLTPGITLPPMWRLIAQEIHAASDRHRFDILMTIMNQAPSALMDIERRVRRWRSGAGKGAGNTISSRMACGDRIFVVAVRMADVKPSDDYTWAPSARMIGTDLAEKFGATDCVVVLKVRRSSRLTFDGISFFRFPRPRRPDDRSKRTAVE